MRQLVRLTFDGPLHIGIRGVGLEAVQDWVPSDTLFAGIANAWREVHGVKDLEDMLSMFRQGSPPFAVSSAFPVVGQTWFLPAPRLQPNTFEDVAPAGCKRAVFASPELFDMWTTKRVAKDVLEQALEQSNDVLDSGVQRIVRSRDRVDRGSGATNLFFVGETHFAGPGSGLWFIIEAADADLAKLRSAVDCLGILGLGGERSAGFGRFKSTLLDLPTDATPLARLLDDRASTRRCLIARFLPSATDLRSLRPEHLRGCGYRLVRITGWVGSRYSSPGQRQATCRMFGEGSVFTSFFDPVRVAGSLADVTPRSTVPGSHRVYRYGFALTVGAG